MAKQDQASTSKQPQQEATTSSRKKQPQKAAAKSSSNKQPQQAAATIRDALFSAVARSHQRAAAARRFMGGALPLIKLAKTQVEGLKA